MTPDPPSEQAPYPAPIPDWLEKGETPTPEQEREELLSLARIFEKDRAETNAKAATVITPEEREEILEACREIVKEEADAKTKAEVQARIQTRSKVATEAAARYWAETD